MISLLAPGQGSQTPGMLSPWLALPGAQDRLEVWSKAAWAEQEEMIHDATANEDRFAALDLLIHPQ